MSSENDDPVLAFEQGLERLASSFEVSFGNAPDEHALRAINARFVGPQGELTGLLKWMPKLPSATRRPLGQRANELKNKIQSAFDGKLAAIRSAARAAELEGPWLDVTLPGRQPPVGRLHPITRVMNELLDVFTSIGFDIADGPEVERHEYNFDKLGFPPDHPATDMQDSFYVEGASNHLLRTHTSTIQVREMLRRKPPMAIVAPGAVYRRDDDVTHSPMFFQLEGFLIDEHVTFAHLKGVLTLFLQRVFGPNTPVRFRPSYFPFVEPGGEVDIGWRGRQGAAADEPVRWLEILGCGMIHPVVFESVGYDPNRYTGFAFGMGIDRIAMLRYGITDIRLLYENDARFLAKLD